MDCVHCKYDNLYFKTPFEVFSLHFHFDIVSKSEDKCPVRCPRYPYSQAFHMAMPFLLL